MLKIIVQKVVNFQKSLKSYKLIIKDSIMFKKKKIKTKSIKNFKDNHEAYKKSKKKWSILSNIFSILSIVAVVYVWNILINNISIFSKPLNFVTNFEETIKNEIKTTDWKINILLTWKGWWNHDAPNLTDTIILASLNTKTKTTTLFSIPRDFFVKYPDWEEGKINEIYFRGLKHKKTHKEAMKDLENKVTQITWEEILYNINVDFKWFTQIIDTLWWITINIPEDLKDTEYPDWNYWYETFEIKKWNQKLDWATALKYARSRHSTSDFDRSKRQQLIIQATKDKVQNLWFLTNWSKVKDLYLTLSKNIKTDMQVWEIIALALYAKDIDRNHIKTFNLNDSCYFDVKKCSMWWFMHYPPRSDFKDMSVVLPFWADRTNLENYNEVQKYANLAFNHPMIYQDNIQINIFNGTPKLGLAYKFANKLIRYGFNIPEKDSIWNARDAKYSKSTIFYNNIDENDETLNALKLFFFTNWIKTETPKFSKDPNTKIEIVIWNNYRKLGL